MYPHLNNLINDKDPTGYVDLKFIGKQGETMWDKRFGPESYFAEFFVFSVNYKHSDEIKLYVKSEFIGGCDIIKEMYESGELLELFNTKGMEIKPS